MERRTPAIGGVVHLHINEGKIEKSEIIIKDREPRGIHILKNKLALSTASCVHVWEDRDHYTVENDWLSYVHTVEFSPYDEDLLLISSSGLDTLIEVNFRKNAIIREWCAWENGLNMGVNPSNGNSIFLTRDENHAEELRRQKKEVFFIQDPKRDYLPTAMRAAFINSAYYDSSDPQNVVGTLFHAGKVLTINLDNGTSTSLLSGLKNPHGGRKLNGSIMATNTGSGEVILQNGQLRVSYDFKNLPGKPEFLGDLEWLQNSHWVNDFIATIDSNRNSIVLFNPDRGLIDIVPFDDCWAVQDFVHLTDQIDPSVMTDITQTT